MTFSPKEEVHGAFGHSAVRVQDLKLGTDVVYDYGVYDFDEPQFITKFLRGKLKYSVGRNDTQRAFFFYKKRADRRVIEQEMNLDKEAKQRLVAYLEKSYLPENRKYLYDFFFDNCATRIRDMVENALGETLVYNAEEQTGRTLRQLLDVYIQERSWLDFGIDLILGIPADQAANNRNQMFLPDFLSQSFREKAQVKTTTGLQPLLSAPVVIIDVPAWIAPEIFLSPFVLFTVLSAVLLVLSLFGRFHRFLIRIDGVLFFILGLMGLVMLFMWLGTDHDATQWNLNVIWANPLYLLFFVGVMKGRPRMMRWAYAIAFITSIVVLLGWSFIPQQFHIAIIPILILLLARSAFVFKNFYSMTN